MGRLNGIVDAIEQSPIGRMVKKQQEKGTNERSSDPTAKPTARRRL